MRPSVVEAAGETDREAPCETGGKTIVVGFAGVLQLRDNAEVVVRPCGRQAFKSCGGCIPSEIRVEECTVHELVIAVIANIVQAEGRFVAQGLLQLKNSIPGTLGS